MKGNWDFYMGKWVLKKKNLKILFGGCDYKRIVWGNLGVGVGDWIILILIVVVVI